MKKVKNIILQHMIFGGLIMSLSIYKRLGLTSDAHYRLLNHTDPYFNMGAIIILILLNIYFHVSKLEK